jgi:hypothetical protein
VIDAMERMSHREYKMRLAWETEQWQKPSRTDFYLMQIAQLLSRLPGGQKVANLNRFKLLFSEVGSSETLEQKQQRANDSMAAWGSILRKR